MPGIRAIAIIAVVLTGCAQGADPSFDGGAFDAGGLDSGGLDGGEIDGGIRMDAARDGVVVDAPAADTTPMVDSGPLCASAGCDPVATCDDSSGVAVCTCPAGYDDPSGDGTMCVDIDECMDGTAGCAAEATCMNTPGSFTCTCGMGYTGDGLTCTDVDECMDGTAGCAAEATCMNTPGSFTCTCGMGYSGDGFTCTDIDECMTGMAGCDPVATCMNTPGSFTCTCPMGYTDVRGDGTLCRPPASGGHAVLIGHDYFASNADVDRLVGNAVFLHSGAPVRVLAYTQYADTSGGGEVANTDMAINSVASATGRSWSRTTLTNYTSLATMLPSYDVLLVYEQENTTEAMLTTIGTSWRTALSSFVAGGGVVVVCDFNGSSGGTWQIMNSGGLMTISSSTRVSTGAAVTVTAPADPVAASVGSPYSATNGTLSFTTTETTVVTTSGGPVVIHKTF